MTKKKQKLNPIFYLEQSHKCFECGIDENYFSYGASKFFNKPICARCGNTDYRRSYDFKNPEDSKVSHRKVIPFDYMEKEQHEVAWLDGLLSDLRWLIRLVEKNNLTQFKKWEN